MNYYDFGLIKVLTIVAILSKNFTQKVVTVLNDFYLYHHFPILNIDNHSNDSYFKHSILVSYN